MKRDFADYHYVPAEQVAMHDRLTNWARYFADRWVPAQAAIWKLGKSNTRQWHEPEPKRDVDQLDAMTIEKAVRALPVVYREVLRWAYVDRTSPMKIRRKLGLSAQDLLQALNEARTMLKNRKV